MGGNTDEENFQMLLELRQWTYCRLSRAGKKLNALGQQNGFAVRLTLFLPMLKIRISKDIANSLRFLCLEFGSA